MAEFSLDDDTDGQVAGSDDEQCYDDDDDECQLSPDSDCWPLVF